MVYLCDTQLLLWLGNTPEKLPKDAVTIFSDYGSDLYFSVVSLWEIAIKSALGQKDFIADPKLIAREMLQAGLKQLDIKNEHVYRVATLRPIHHDPFDRLLVAQAEIEGHTLMTTDKKLAQYGPFIRRLK